MAERSIEATRLSSFPSLRRANFKATELVNFTGGFCPKSFSSFDKHLEVDESDIGGNEGVVGHSSSVRDVEQNDVGNTSHSHSSTSMSMNQCIVLLEPHLGAFREKCKQGAKGQIPPQLLRIMRFFHFEWITIKRALLRPASAEEFEVGSETRICLAKALHSKGFLDIAEIEALLKSFQKTHFSSLDDNKFRTRKRRVEEGKLFEEVRISLSRLPIDAANPAAADAALCHVREILTKYCDCIKTLGERHKYIDNLNNVTDILFVSEVADWVMTAFAGVVVTNGIDGPTNEYEEPFVFEWKFVKMITSLSNLSPLAEAVNRRITELIESPCIDSLSNLNLLCLGRYFSYSKQSVVEKYISKSILSSFSAGGGSGFKAVPKLIASYVSIYLSRLSTTQEPWSFFLSVKHNVHEEITKEKKLRPKVNIDISDNPSLFYTRSDHEREMPQIVSFINLMFESSTYLLQMRKMTSTSPTHQDSS